ncbi:MAG: hypothetical protein O2923_06915 [Verrucomicrobia bacterium]|nr:hypothetical protein [Verrucomicrobiota bacterium]MDA1087732.1 hypothetical protein [Verrucomicrobiota bacterium]
MSVLPDIMEQRNSFARRERGRGVLRVVLEFLGRWAVPIALLTVAILFRQDVLAFLIERMPYVF